MRLGILGQTGREILGRRQIGLAGLFVEQPDPAGVQPEQVGDLSQNRLQCLIHLHRGVEGLQQCC